MSLVQVRQKESSFRREETVRTSVRERTNERANEGKEKQGREKGAEEADDPEVVQPAERETVQKRARIMNILKSHKALSAGFHPDVFSTRVHREQRQPPRCFLYLIRFLPVLMPLSLATIFPSFLFHFPFLFSAAHTISLLASAVCEPINQCEIFALARLTEGPPCHLWALKRVANIANKK